MAKISKRVETQKHELKVQIREAKQVDLHVELASGNLEKTKIQFFGEKLESEFVVVHSTPISQLCYTARMSRFTFGCERYRAACG